MYFFCVLSLFLGAAVQSLALVYSTSGFLYPNSSTTSNTVTNSSEARLLISSTSSQSHGLGDYVLQGIDPDVSSQTSSAGTGASLSSGTSITSENVTKLSTLAPLKGSTPQSISPTYRNITTSPVTGFTSNGSMPNISKPQTTTFPESWLRTCPQLSLATYITPIIGGQANSSEYISSCEAARRAYTSALSAFNSTIQETHLSGTAFTKTHVVTISTLNTTTPFGVFTLCDQFPRLNLTTYHNYVSAYMTTPAVPMLGLEKQSAYVSSCVFNGTSPTFPSPPGCTIPPASCGAFYSSWALTGDIRELKQFPSDDGYTGTINTPACYSSDIPYFSCVAMVTGRDKYYITCNDEAARCTITADQVQVYYWPDTARSGGFCGSKTTTKPQSGPQSDPQYATITVAPNDVVTITSPTAFVSFNDVHVGNSSYLNATALIDPATMSSLEHRLQGFEGDAEEELRYMMTTGALAGYPIIPVLQSFDFANLAGPVPASAYFFGGGLQGYLWRAFATYGGLEMSHDQLDTTMYLDYSAMLAVPSEIRRLHPGWEECVTTMYGAFDPPSKLTAESIAAAATLPNFATTTSATAAASTSASPVQSIEPVAIITSSSSKVPPTPSKSSVAGSASGSGPAQPASSSVSNSGLPQSTSSPAGGSSATQSTASPAGGSSAIQSTASPAGGSSAAEFTFSPASSSGATELTLSSAGSSGAAQFTFSPASSSNTAQSAATPAGSSSASQFASSPGGISSAAQIIPSPAGSSSRHQTISASLSPSNADPASASPTSSNAFEEIANSSDSERLTVNGISTTATQSGLLIVAGSTVVLASAASDSGTRGLKIQSTVAFASAESKSSTHSSDNESGVATASSASRPGTHGSVTVSTSSPSPLVISQVISSDSAGRPLTQNIVNGHTYNEGQTATIGPSAFSIISGQLVADGQTASFAPFSPIHSTAAAGGASLAADPSHLAIRPETDANVVPTGAVTLTNGQVTVVGTQKISVASGSLLVVPGNTPASTKIADVVAQNSSPSTSSVGADVGVGHAATSAVPLSGRATGWVTPLSTMTEQVLAMAVLLLAFVVV